MGVVNRHDQGCSRLRMNWMNSPGLGCACGKIEFPSSKGHVSRCLSKQQSVSWLCACIAIHPVDRGSGKAGRSNSVVLYYSAPTASGLPRGPGPRSVRCPSHEPQERTQTSCRSSVHLDARSLRGATQKRQWREAKDLPLTHGLVPCVHPCPGRGGTQTATATGWLLQLHRVWARPGAMLCVRQNYAARLIAHHN